MALKRSTKILILIAIAALLTTGVAIAINGNLRFLTPNLDLVQDYSDIEESPRQVTVPLLMTELPEYFNASIILQGSFYTGQSHTIYVQISHTRPDSSVWLAAGDYALTLENVTYKEPIASNSFSELRNTEPYGSQGFDWTPTMLADITYNLVLNLNNLTWTILPEYTITSSAGINGTITPLGAFTLEEGDDLIFYIMPNPGYSIENVRVDGIIIMDFDSESSYLFENITADHTIHATFVKEYIITASAGEGGTISPEGSFGVIEGTDQQFLITADSGYEIKDVLVDSVSVGVVSTHDFFNITADHTISASFVEIATYDMSRSQLTIIGELPGLTIEDIVFDKPAGYLTNDTVSFNLTAVWDVDPAASLNSITYNVHVLAPTGGTWVWVINSASLTFNPAIPDGGTLHIVNSFEQPEVIIPGDWSFSVSITGIT